jgi:hypothetical protein
VDLKGQGHILSLEKPKGNASLQKIHQVVPERISGSEISTYMLK